MPEILKRIRKQFCRELEKELVKAGSSMKNVLKVSVFLNDMADYDGMNAVYRLWTISWGDKPPVRTTSGWLSQKESVPGNSLVEMDSHCFYFLIFDRPICRNPGFRRAIRIK